MTKTCAAIGIFDGVHGGHQYLIQQMLLSAKRLKAKPIVITFFPHPAHVLRPDLKLEYLSSLKDRFSLLKSLRVAACCVVRFDRSFAHIEPQKFIRDILVKKLGVKAVFVGADFRFGKDRSGDIVLFQELGSKYGYEMHAVDQIKEGNAIISSTRVRQCVTEGKLNEAERLLGRKVSISGTVVKGAQRGRTFGYPTANVEYDVLHPPQGVYFVLARLGQKSYPAIANIGTRPSFEKQNVKLYLEVHILDFSRNIYGRHMQVEFIKKIRDEKKFATVADLVKQIQKDEALARQLNRTL